MSGPLRIEVNGAGDKLPEVEQALQELLLECGLRPTQLTLTGPEKDWVVARLEGLIHPEMSVESVVINFSPKAQP